MSDETQEPLLRTHLNEIEAALTARERHLRNAARNADSAGEDPAPYEARLATTRATLSWVEGLLAVVANVKVTDYGGCDPRFPQFDVSLNRGDVFAAGGHEGVRDDRQNAQIRPVEIVEAESIVGLAATLECRRRYEVKS